MLILGWVYIGSTAEKGLPPLRSYFADSEAARADSSQPQNQRLYLAPGPLKPGKVVVEYLSGSLFSLFGGFMGGAVGSNLVRHDSETDDNSDFGQIFVVLLGYMTGSAIGSTFGVCIGGNSGGEHGSTWGTLAGSVIGTAAGLGLASAVAQNDYDNFVPAFTVYTLTQVSGAVLGFNLSRKKVVYKSQSP